MTNKIKLYFLSLLILPLILIGNNLELEALKTLKNLGFHILTWTVDTPEKYKKSQKLADNCIFEKIKIY